MQPELQHGEQERLREADDQQARAGREDDLLQGQRGEDMPQAGCQLGEEVLLLPLESCFGRTDEQEGNRDADEGERICGRHDATTKRGIETGSEQGRDQTQSFPHRGEDRVGIAEQLARQHHGEKRRPRGRKDDAGSTVEARDDVDQPEVAAIVHEEQQQHRSGHDAVHADQQRPLAHAVDDKARERR